MVCIINNYLLIIIFFKNLNIFSYFILYYKIDEECPDPRDWYYFNNIECQRIFTCSSLLFPSKEECMETCNIIIFSLFTGGVLSSHSAIRWKDEKSAQKALFLGGNPCCCYGRITLDDNSFKNRTIGKFALRGHSQTTWTEWGEGGVLKMFTLLYNPYLVKWFTMGEGL